MNYFNLEPSIYPSENEFKKTISKEVWDKMYLNVLNNNNSQCFSCGYQVDDKNKLQPHLEEINKENPGESTLLLLCEACHAIKHFDVFVEKEWGVLCNSIFSQEELIIRCRTNWMLNDIKQKRIVVLKKTPKQYLDEIKESDFNKNSKIKVIFGKKFPWKK